MNKKYEVTKKFEDVLDEMQEICEELVDLEYKFTSLRHDLADIAKADIAGEVPALALGNYEGWTREVDTYLFCIRLLTRVNRRA